MQQPDGPQPQFAQQPQIAPQQPFVPFNSQPVQQQPMQAIPGVQPMAQPVVQPVMPMMQNVTNVNVNISKSGPGFITRALYFIFIGWWAGFFWLNLGFFFVFLVFTMPLGLVMLNSLPKVLTLRSSGTSTNVSVNSTTMLNNGQAMVMNTVNVNISGTAQHSMLVRILYFLLVGWWAGYFWACLGYGCCLTIVLLPVGVMMLNRLPAVLTLKRN